MHTLTLVDNVSFCSCLQRYDSLKHVFSSSVCVVLGITDILCRESPARSGFPRNGRSFFESELVFHTAAMQEFILDMFWFGLHLIEA
jgi:hypothetical protein